MAEQLPELQPQLLEQLLQRHQVFVRSARDAAHQALFFLEMLHPTTSKAMNRSIDEYWETALHQVMALVRGVLVPSLTRKAGSAVADRGEDGPSLPEELKAAISRAGAIAAAWEQLRDSLAWDRAQESYPRDKIPELRAALVRFLDLSRTRGWAWALAKHYFADGLRWLARHLTVFLAAALVLGVSLGVEAVGGLLRNEGWKLLVFVAVLPLPFYAHRVVDLMMRRQETVFRLSVGARPFWNFNPLVIGPGRLIQRWPERTSLLGAIARSQLAKVGLYLGGSLLAVFAIYVWRLLTGSASTLTVPCVLVIFYMILVLANQLDFWDFLFVQPVRFIALLVAAGCFVGLRAGAGRPTFIVAFFCAAVVLGGLSLVSRRNKRLLVICALVAAILAAVNIWGWQSDSKRIWTADEEQQFSRLRADEWPHPTEGPVVVMAASGGGSRAAVLAGLTLEKLNDEYSEIAVRLQAISSVSGGSLANAAYVVRTLPREDDAAAPSKGLVEAVAGDFLFPTLRGAVVPGLTRGASIEQAWQRADGVGLGTVGLGDLVGRWRKAHSAAAPPFPIPLFNTATLEGHDLVISPLAEELFTNETMHDQARSEDNLYDAVRAEGEPTWVYYRHGVYGLENLLPGQDLRLSSAVLASANFPFGFPVVKVEPACELERPLYFSPNPSPSLVKLTDGGTLSNSGMWSLFNLLVNKRDELRRRGVLLIVVEASKMPEYESMKSTFNRLLGTISDQAPIGRNLHERMFDILEHEYRDPETGEPRFASVQVDLTPTRKTNIMTTWALDRVSLEKLRGVFNHRWEAVSPLLEQRWRCLQLGGDSCTGIDLVDRERLPLD